MPNIFGGTNPGRGATAAMSGGTAGNANGSVANPNRATPGVGGSDNNGYVAPPPPTDPFGPGGVAEGTNGTGNGSSGNGNNAPGMTSSAPPPAGDPAYGTPASTAPTTTPYPFPNDPTTGPGGVAAGTGNNGGAGMAITAPADPTRVGVVNNNLTPTTPLAPPRPSTPAAAATGLGGSSYTGATGYNAPGTGTGLPGQNTTYNQQYFGNDQSAKDLASWLGTGYTVGQGNPFGFAAGSNTGPFSFPNANMITGPNGQQVDAGVLQQMIASGAYKTPADAAKEFAGSQPGTAAYNNDQNNPATSYLNTNPYSASPSNLLGGYMPVGSTGSDGTNVLYGSGYGPGTAGGVMPNGGNTNTANPTPGTGSAISAGPGAGLNSGTLGSLSPSDLQSFLASYAALKGGNPTATPPTPGSSTGTLNTSNGQSGTGVDLSTLLSGVLGSGYDLYQRNRNYPTTP